MIETKGRPVLQSFSTSQGYIVHTLMSVGLGGIQVIRHQRGGWVGSENGNF